MKKKKKQNYIKKNLAIDAKPLPNPYLLSNHQKTTLNRQGKLPYCHKTLIAVANVTQLNSFEVTHTRTLPNSIPIYLISLRHSYKHLSFFLPCLTQPFSMAISEPPQPLFSPYLSDPPLIFEPPIL